jgi:hypothetical protein
MRGTEMTLEEIYEEFRAGSAGFVKAVQTHCGFGISNSEIERLAGECPDWWEFEDAWENESWWKDGETIRNTDGEAA